MGGQAAVLRGDLGYGSAEGWTTVWALTAEGFEIGSQWLGLKLERDAEARRGAVLLEARGNAQRDLPRTGAAGRKDAREGAEASAGHWANTSIYRSTNTPQLNHASRAEGCSRTR